MTTATTTDTPLKNPRHELFAQQVAAGITQTDAFIEAYPHAEDWLRKTAKVKGSELAARPDVKARIAELQARAADVSVFTLAAHLNRLNALSIAAEKSGEFTAAVKAEENRGKAAGFYPTKVELTGRGGGPIETKQTRDLTPAELEAELARYGIKP
jgi:phage terminase small subunit